VEPVYQQDSSDAEFNNDINIHDVGEIEGYHSDSSSASAYISDEHSDAEEFAANDVLLGEQLAECVTTSLDDVRSSDFSCSDSLLLI
jgi:hypothetical protein